MKFNVLEQDEMFPARSMACAVKVVVELANTDAAIVNAEGVLLTVPITGPVQEEEAKSLIVTPGSEVKPLMFGLMLAAGETGVVPTSMGAGGVMLSCV